MLREDVRRVKHSMVVFTAVGDWLWGEVADELGALADRGAHIIFVVSTPDFARADNQTILALAAFPSVQLYELPKRPLIELRLVDKRDLYVAHHGVGRGLERYCWYSESGGAPLKELRAANHFIEEALSSC